MGLVAVAIYYAVKIVRLSDKFEYVALKGGRAPYYIVVGMIFLGVDRLFYLLTNWLLALGFGYQFTAALNDPAAPLAGFFVALGLRDMYVVYIRNSKVKRPVPSHQEIWETEEKEVEYSTAHRANKPSRAREALRPDPAEGAAKAKLDDELR